MSDTSDSLEVETALKHCEWLRARRDGGESLSATGAMLIALEAEVKRLREECHRHREDGVREAQNAVRAERERDRLATELEQMKKAQSHEPHAED